MIPLANCDLTALERRAIEGEMADGYISGTGRKIAEFESRWKEKCGRKYAIAVANGTVALELALSSLILHKGDEVIVPALTFVAPAAAVRRAGATPVFVDVDRESWTIDIDHLKQCITSRTVAIIAVDVLGHPCDYDAIYAAVRQYGIWVIEDAAEAHGATYRGSYTGAFGDIATFSFHANKIITTGEGGMILTDDRICAEHIRLIANHGMHASAPYQHEVVGTNARMTNLTAAIGCAQMERWDEIMDRRRQIAARYADVLHAPFIARPYASWAEPSLWLQTVTIDEHRDAVVQHLRDNGIDARALWPALPSLPLYAQNGCSVAKEISQKAFWLPTYNTMGEPEFDIIEEVLRQWM